MRYCEHCNAELHQRRGEADYTFRHRRFCNRDCVNRELQPIEGALRPDRQDWMIEQCRAVREDGFLDRGRLMKRLNRENATLPVEMPVVSAEVFEWR